MTSLELEGDSLGQKHQHYNKLLKEAIEKQQSSDTPFEIDDDIENFLKIDIASHDRNVEYILETLKSRDMLYVSRAIKKCTWLITDEQYAHIINPEYLHTQLFPHMMTKAIGKLVLNIRLHLKDETRVDAFYIYEKENNPKSALKWLQYCSLSMVERESEHLGDNLQLLKRLCRRSVSVLEAYIQNAKHVNYNTLITTMFLMKTCTEKYLDIMKTVKSYCTIPSFGPKYTDIVMKVCPHRILNNFEDYVNDIDYRTLAKHLNEEDVMDFLLMQSKNVTVYTNLRFFFSYSNIAHFVRRMPEKNRFKYLKQIFINGESTGSPECDLKMYATLKAMKNTTELDATEAYRWYEFAPFDEAFHDLIKLIRAETSSSKRVEILMFLFECAGQNYHHKQLVLQYYHEKHINEPLNVKNLFVIYFLTESDVTKFNEKTWGILDKLFHSMDVYIKCENNVQIFVETIIIYNAIHGKNTPQIIKNKFDFNTLNTYIHKLNKEEKEKVFGFLYNHLLTKIGDEKIETQKGFKKVVVLLEDVLELLKDWKKELLDYPLIQNKIDDLIKIKIENKWNINMSSLYTVNKLWRKQMFAQSLILYPTDKACLNVLKHDAKLLSRHKDEVIAIICSENATTAMAVLRKLRIYWPHSLATDLKNIILKSLATTQSEKSMIKILVALLPQEQLQQALMKYAPQENKINWGEEDALLINLRKHFAMNMHFARPSIPLKVILYYAKGDYLQYTVPSLCSVLHNLSRFQSSQELPELLKAPVSLQKHGIHVAVIKLKAGELKPLFTNLWKRTTNPTIRAVLFKETFNSLRAEKNTLLVQEKWELLSMYIDNLTLNEPVDIIINMMGDVAKVPHPYKGEFYMKSYIFLNNLPNHLSAKYKYLLTNIINYAPNVMDFIDPGFVTDVILQSVGHTFDTQNCHLFRVLTSFLLSSQNADTQNERYEKVLCPLLNRYLPAWNKEHEGKKYVQSNFRVLLKQLRDDLKCTLLDKKKVNPVTIFTNILNKLEKTLSSIDNYLLITSWKLMVAFLKLIDGHRSALPDIEFDENMYTQQTIGQKAKISKAWDKIFLYVAPQFAKICCEYLKDDTERYFPTVFFLFGEAIKGIMFHKQFETLFTFLKCVLDASSSVETYLLVISICPKFNELETKENETLAEIRALINSHPSPQVRMHFMAKVPSIV